MTTIGIIGAGKMGQAIIDQLTGRPGYHYHLFHRLSAENQHLLESCQVVIEFTTPEAAPGVIRHCIESNVPIVSGTTGWHEYHLSSIIKLCQDAHAKFLYASNFSVGMNITFALNRRLTTIMNQFTQFKPSLREIHHIHKKDAPSGTALSLVDDIIGYHTTYSDYALNPSGDQLNEEIIPVTAIREGEVKGYHEVTWNSGREKITISHEAFDRTIFADGAILAARWLIDQPAGVYTMKDIVRL